MLLCHRAKGRMEQLSVDARDPADLEIRSRMGERSYRPEMTIACRSEVEPSSSAGYENPLNSGYPRRYKETSPSFDDLKGIGGRDGTRFTYEGFDEKEKGTTALSLPVILTKARENTDAASLKNLGSS